MKQACHQEAQTGALAAEDAWGYSKECDLNPKTWASVWPQAAGSRQSPINIQRETVQFRSQLKNPPLQPSYLPEHNLKICNNGHTVKAEITQQSTLTGGPLGHKVYRLAQFHLHWGSEDDSGSEHKVDGQPCSAEIHFVHWNSSDYNNIDEAASESDGLAVLCVFVKVGSRHEEFGKISEQLHHVSYKNADHRLGAITLDPARLLPGNITNFWTYPGSLTTPPCDESVQFVVFQKNVEFSADQMAALRSLHAGGEDSAPLSDNFRPVCPLHNRIVQASFADYSYSAGVSQHDNDTSAHDLDETMFNIPVSD